MEIYTGTALSPGVAIAVAARLTDNFGASRLAPERERHMGETLLRAGLDLPDPDQIVLVAQRLPPGYLAAPLPGLEIIGAALAEVTDAPVPAPCPVAGGLGDDFYAQTEEGEIMIVDGDRGRVYVSPDAPTLARYQGPGRRGRRFHVEPAHLAAVRASDGQAVAVLAAATDWAGVQDALASGVDGILLPLENALLSGEGFDTASEQLLRLRQVVDTLGGKLLLVEAPLERVALSALARAAAWGPVGLVVTLPALAAEARAEMDALEPELEAGDIPFGRVRLEVLRGEGDASFSEPPDDADGIILTTTPPAPDDARAFWLAGISLTALLPGDTSGADLTAWLDAGITRLVVPASQVQAVKEAVRQS